MLGSGPCTSVLLLALGFSTRVAALQEELEPREHPTERPGEGSPSEPASAREVPAGDPEAREAEPRAPDPPAVKPEGAGFEYSGSATLGLRSIDVDGNRSQFDEDVNLESGLLLTDFDLEGRRPEGSAGLESFTLSGFGLGTREAGLRASAALPGLAVLGRYGRTLFSGTTDSDLHAFDFERESGSLALEREGRGGTLRQAALALSFLRRDGVRIGSLATGSRAVPDVPVELDERRLGGDGRVGLAFGELELDLQAGLEDLDTEHELAFETTHPIFPQSTVSEDFRAFTEGLARRASVRLRSDAIRDVGWDVGLAWHSLESNGSSDQHETGIFNDPDLPFVSDTLGDAELEASALEVDAGLLWQVTDEAEVEVRFTHEREQEDGSLLQTVVVDEFSGAPPETSTFLDDLRLRSRLALLEASLSTPLGEHLDLELSVETGREEIDYQDLSDEVVVRRFDDTVDLYGGRCALGVATGPASTLELDGGFGITPTESSEVGVEFTFEDTRTSFGALGWRWQPAPGEALAAEIRHEQRRSEAFHSEGESDAMSCSGSTRIGRSLTLEGSFTYRAYDLDADTTFVIFAPGPTEVAGRVSSEGIQRIVTGGVGWDTDTELQPLLFANLSTGDGDGSFDYGSLGLDVPWHLAERLDVGANLALLRFDGNGPLEERDYDAAVLTLYARTRF